MRSTGARRDKNIGTSKAGKANGEDGRQSGGVRRCPAPAVMDGSRRSQRIRQVDDQRCAARRLPGGIDSGHRRSSGERARRRSKRFPSASRMHPIEHAAGSRRLVHHEVHHRTESPDLTERLVRHLDEPSATFPCSHLLVRWMPWPTSRSSSPRRQTRFSAASNSGRREGGAIAARPPAARRRGSSAGRPGPKKAWNKTRRLSGLNIRRISGNTVDDVSEARRKALCRWAG